MKLKLINETVSEIKTRALLVDMDGILFDTETYSINSIIDIVARQGLEITREYIIAHMGMGPADILTEYKRHLGPKFNAELYWETYWKERNEHFEKNSLPLKPGAIELLAECKNKGVPCVLATSSPQKEGLASLARAGVDMYFADCVGGDMFEHSKPQPDIYLTAASLAGVSIEDCVVLEDSLNGLKSGRASGARTVMIPDIVPFSEAHRPYCDYLGETLADVTQLLN